MTKRPFPSNPENKLPHLEIYDNITPPNKEGMLEPLLYAIQPMDKGRLALRVNTGHPRFIEFAEFLETNYESRQGHNPSLFTISSSGAYPITTDGLVKDLSKNGFKENPEIVHDMEELSSFQRHLERGANQTSVQRTTATISNKLPNR